LKALLAPAGLAALDLFLPAPCEACEQPLELGSRSLCTRCLGSIRWLGSGCCRHCGGPLSELGRARRCVRCRHRRPRFDWLVAAAAYEGAVRQMLLRMKYGPEPRLARTLVRLTTPVLVSALAVRPPLALIPVPLHPERRRLRGFNQAEQLASELAPRLRLPVWHGLLARPVATEAQAGLAGSARRTNVAQAFAAGARGARRLRGARVALVDDVASTGSTLDACAQVLRQLGAREVGAIVIAAALPD
jgi:ComF family protein